MARNYKLAVEITGKGRDSIIQALESIGRELGKGEKAGKAGSEGTRARGEFKLELVPGGEKPTDPPPKRPTPPPKQEAEPDE